MLAATCTRRTVKLPDIAASSQHTAPNPPQHNDSEEETLELIQPEGNRHVCKASAAIRTLIGRIALDQISEQTEDEQSLEIEYEEVISEGDAEDVQNKVPLANKGSAKTAKKVEDHSESEDEGKDEGEYEHIAPCTARSPFCCRGVPIHNGGQQ
jgi:hypothetical protein